jgi:hypothetical protein
MFKKSFTLLDTPFLLLFIINAQCFLELIVGSFEVILLRNIVKFGWGLVSLRVEFEEHITIVLVVDVVVRVDMRYSKLRLRLLT